MAESTVTITGLEELARAVQDLPAAVRDELQAHARTTAQRIHDRARANLIAHQKTQSRKLADNIKVEDQPADHLVAVVSYPPIGQPTGVTIWNEHGTARMAARPYMRPALEAERDAYTRGVEAAVQRVINRLE